MRIDLKCRLPWDPEYDEVKYAIKLPLIYSIILKDYFPGNRELKWRFHYLRACCWYNWHCSGVSVHQSLYNLALEYCDDADQKFLCLRHKINFAHRLHVSKRCEESYDGHVSLCVAQISSESKLHRELGESLRSKLLDCLNTLVSNNHLGAIQKFDTIDFDAYSRKAYLGATVLYYQLEAVLTIMGRVNKLKEIDESCDAAKFCIIKHCLCMARENIDKFYATHSAVMYQYAFNFSDFLLDLPNQDKPKPGKALLTMANSNKHFKILSIEPDLDRNISNRPTYGL